MKFKRQTIVYGSILVIKIRPIIMRKFILGTFYENQKFEFEKYCTTVGYFYVHFKFNDFYISFMN